MVMIYDTVHCLTIFVLLYHPSKKSIAKYYKS